MELGAGSGEKLRDACRGRRPPAGRRSTIHLVDVSAAALARGGAVRWRGSPGVHVVTHEASYEDGPRTARVDGAGAGRALVLFLGSNIGNFDPPGAEAFLGRIRARACARATRCCSAPIW